ncbi:hypothetical protein FA15DRAFT_709059 [Coprinopsis marcescibilis]|uniref:F-box domain-containing protein n=1 Tax=Coprinopsis marcescibilis TaxID=230819 RepID=A0A5C3KH17_COPMA|nr:hypothetical protein FA15DRAFT_709059 [Coprinopsis marcescibilis]
MDSNHIRPIETVPEDVLETIFTFSAPTYPKFCTPNPNIPPLSFGQVCSHWRGLASRHHRLWTSLRLHPRHEQPHTYEEYASTISRYISQAQHWFERAAPLQCSLTITFPTLSTIVASSYTLLDTLTLSRRMRDCIESTPLRSLHIEEHKGTMMGTLLSSRSALSRVSSLSLVSAGMDPQELFQVLSSSSSKHHSQTFWPAVHKLNLSFDAFQSQIWSPPSQLPWMHLTHLSSDIRLGAWTWATILDSCTTLEHCVIHVTVDREPEPLPTGSAMLSALTSLTINTHAQGVEKFLCGRLWCPALTSLRLTATGRPGLHTPLSPPFSLP